MMNKCSYFIKDKALFGAYPSQENIKELEADGVTLFVDLTSKKDNLPEYAVSETSRRISFPITDYGIPSDLPDFCRLILLLEKKIKTLKPDEKVYIFCRAGHSRSGLTIATLLAKYYGITGEEAIKLATQAHRQRKYLTSVRRNNMCPDKVKQRDFVIHLFEPILFYKPSKTGIDRGFSNFSPHSVYIPELGQFHNAESAFQAFKDPTNKEYVSNLQREENPYLAKKMGSKCNLRKDWLKVRDEIMYRVLRAKFSQNPDIKNALLDSGFRPLIYHTDKDRYFGNGGYEKQDGKNMLGKILERIREKMFIELYKN